MNRFVDQIARRAGESLGAYRKRRAELNEAVADALRPHMLMPMEKGYRGERGTHTRGLKNWRNRNAAARLADKRRRREQRRINTLRAAA